MDLLPSDDQVQIVDALKNLLLNQAPVDRLRAHGALGNPDAALWPKLAELGFLQLGLSEAHGGVGLSAAEEMLVFVEYGRHLMSPGIFGLVIAARIAALSENKALLEQLLSGGVSVGVANPRGPQEVSDTISGEFHLFEATEAPWILLTTVDGAGLMRRQAFLDIRPVESTDSVLTLERARLEKATPEHWIPTERENIHAWALMLIGAYAVGIGEGARDMAVDYAKVREQFGRPIGGFQAIKHICADMAIRSEAALCQASFAALAVVDRLADLNFHVVASKIVATDAALKNAAANIQVHGAFGFTSEANAHHYLKRAHVMDLLWGSLREQRDRLLTLPTPA